MKIFFIALFLFSSLTFAGEKFALVIVDMQEHFLLRKGHLDRPGNKEKVETLIRYQLELIELFKRLEFPVVLIEYANRGETFSDLKESLAGYSKAVTFVKTSDGMLENRNVHKEALQNYFKKNGVKNIVMTGANGGGCIQASIQSALENQYDVYGMKKGIADFNYEDFIYPYLKSVFPEGCQECHYRGLDDTESLLTIMSP